MTAIDTTRDSLTLVFSFSYRGNAEEFSQTYFMDGTTPSSAASWKTLADAVIASAKTAIPSDHSIIRAVGHTAGESVAVWEYDYAAHSASVAGTMAISGGVIQSGDTAYWVRWSTAAKTGKGKPIYLRNYFHPAITVSGTPDVILPAVITAVQAYATAWITGFTDGDATVHHRAGPHGASGQAPVLGSPWATTRTLERRGKRPT